MCMNNSYKLSMCESLEEIHKGELHKLSKIVQEEQGVVNCYV